MEYYDADMRTLVRRRDGKFFPGAHVVVTMTTGSCHCGYCAAETYQVMFNHVVPGEICIAERPLTGREKFGMYEGDKRKVRHLLDSP